MSTATPIRRGRTFAPTDLDRLECRAVPTASVVGASKSIAVDVSSARPPFETIRGRITSEETGRGIGQVRVDLIDSDGDLVRSTRTGPGGRYAFHVRWPGAYVVRQVVPRRFIQTSPTFLFDEPTGEYAPGRGPSSWNYRTGNDDPANGPVGPPHWDTIAPAGELPFASPIDLTGPSVDLGDFLSIEYSPAVPKAIVNDGAQIQVQFDASPSGAISAGGEDFALTQFHFHDAAENALDGQVFPMEVHFVNASSGGAETVVAVFVRLGAHNDAFDPILDAATADLGRPNTSTTIGSAIDFAGLLPSRTEGYFFQGALTTPPLSGPVNWFVFATPITIDYAQLQRYEAVAALSDFLTNNRPLQPLDGRQLNEFTVNLVFSGKAIRDVDFELARRPRSGAGRV